MTETRRVSRPLLLAVLALAGSPPAAPREPTDGALAMGEAAQAFEALDAGLRARERGASLSNARKLVAALERARTVRPQRDVESLDAFERHVDRALELSAEIVGSVETGRADEAGELLESVRATCVGCHVRFREETPELGLFPARRNVVSGYVRISSPDGERREDATGIVVFVDAVPGDFEPPRRPAVVSQKDRMFNPRVLPILRGTRVAFPNDDTIFHNAFSLSRARPFDLGVYENGASKSVDFEENGLVRVYCNIHPSMVLNILVLENPFFAVTDGDGHYVITDVPDGTFVLRTWYEFGEEVRTPLELSGSRHVRADLDVTASKTVVAHRNKFGKPYRAKY